MAQFCLFFRCDPSEDLRPRVLFILLWSVCCFVHTVGFTTEVELLDELLGERPLEDAAHGGLLFRLGLLFSHILSVSLLLYSV